MPFYLVTARYSAEAFGKMVASPSDREAVTRPFVEAFGARLHHFFLAFGAEDIVALIEAPDDAAMAALALAMREDGALASASTTKLLTSEEAEKAMQAAGAALAGFRPGA